MTCRATLGSVASLCILAVLGCRKKPAEAIFRLEPGRYSLRMRLKMLKKGKLQSEDQRTNTVEVTVDGEEVTITYPEQGNYPIVGQLMASQLVAHLNDAGGTADFVGSLTADNRMEGTLVGKSRDGDQTVEGIWSLEPIEE